MGTSNNQPPVYIGPEMEHTQELAFINQNFTLLNNQLQTFGYSDSVTVTRAAGSDTQSADVVTGILNSPVFLVFANVPNSFPAFRRPLPSITYDGTTGAIWKSLRAFYDPTLGVIRCFVESSGVDPLRGTAETWVFSFYLLKPTV